jgi:hypothetical protein
VLLKAMPWGIVALLCILPDRSSNYRSKHTQSSEWLALRRWAPVHGMRAFDLR